MDSATSFLAYVHVCELQVPISSLGGVGGLCDWVLYVGLDSSQVSFPNFASCSSLQNSDATFFGIRIHVLGHLLSLLLRGVGSPANPFGSQDSSGHGALERAIFGMFVGMSRALLIDSSFATSRRPRHGCKGQVDEQSSRRAHQHTEACPLRSRNGLANQRVARVFSNVWVWSSSTGARIAFLPFQSQWSIYSSSLRDWLGCAWRP